jgi:hypothetical protein
VSCPAGSEGCPCVDSECIGGLICESAICVAGGTGTSGPDMNTSTSTSTSSIDDSTSDTGTATTPSDESTTGDANTCGNKVLDADEQCDGTPGCSDTCEFEADAYDCNPLNNFPCPMGFKCSVIEPEPFDVRTVCLPVPAGPPIAGTDDPPPGGIHDSNCVYGGEAHDEWCDIGLACAYSSLTDACDVNCCVEFCDLTEPTRCAWPDDECRSFFNPGIPSGLEHLGWCVRP